MKHINLFEDFDFPMGSESTGNSNHSGLIISSYDMDNVEELMAKANDFGFTALRSRSTASTYLRRGKIWAIECGPDLYFYQPSVDPLNPITTPANKRITLADFCNEIGCDETERLSKLAMQ